MGWSGWDLCGGRLLFEYVFVSEQVSEEVREGRRDIGRSKGVAEN